jgi:hypothetical protein
MKCVECRRLQAVHGHSLTDKQRGELKSASKNAFLWLSCSKHVLKLSHGQTRVLEQVLSERRCESYLSLNGARTRERPNGTSSTSNNGRMDAKPRQTLTIDVNCPFCRVYLDGRNTIVEHLIFEHRVDRRMAVCFFKKVLEWRQKNGDLSPRMTQAVEPKGGSPTLLSGGTLR